MDLLDSHKKNVYCSFQQHNMTSLRVFFHWPADQNLKVYFIKKKSSHLNHLNQWIFSIVVEKATQKFP